jgi:hypothetical protein
MLGENGMTTMVNKLKALALVAASVSLLGSGCSQPEEIDRVQPNLVKKSDLTGEWYILDTVTRAPYASHDAFIGYQGPLDRGVFEVEESTLYFYRTYEFVEGLESQGIKSDSDTPLLDSDGNVVKYEKTMPDGSVKSVTRYVFRSSPLARYAITGHYDVRQTYNALTGEGSNVTVEDSSEKYWWQREFMRVNFGSDTAENYSRLSYAGFYNATVFEGETGSDDVKFRVEDGGSYMDFVTKAWMQAPQMYLSYYGWIPTCLFYPWYTGSYYECNEEEIHVRTSYMKVDPNNTYVPQNYDDHMLNKFGFYRSSRGHWNESYAASFSDAIRNIRRFRIFEDYIDTDGDGNLDYADMTPKPVVYYLSEDYPRELLGGAMDLADNWDKPFKDTVENLTGKAYDGQMFVVCENNNAEVQAVLAENPDALLAETDPRYCKDMDRRKQIGDMRYNNLVSVNEPTQFGLYGYGPMNSDPITGETIHANAFNYTANMRLGARTAVDMIEYAAGVQSFRDITQAQHITSKIKADRLSMTEQSPRKVISVESAQELAGTVMVPSVVADLTTAGLETTDLDHAAAGMSKLLGTNDFDYLWLNEDMAALVGLPVEHMGVQPDDGGFLQDRVHPAHMGSDSMLHWKRRHDSHLGKIAICMGDHFDDSFAGLAAEYKPLYDKKVCDGLRGQEGLVFDFNAFNELGSACGDDASVCTADQICTAVDQGEVSGKYCITPCSTGALLDQIRKEIRIANQISDFDYWDPNALYASTKDAEITASQTAARDLIEGIREQVFAEVFDRIWSTVAMHEVGHNVGLRHNFASSTDALNYFPEYWNIKGFTDDNGDWHATSVFDRETDSQVANRIREYQQTSIMEYTGAFNARYQGLGAYDRAAILFGYGGLVETFAKAPSSDVWGKYLAEPSSEDPSEFGLYPRREHPLARALRKVHYTNLPEVFGGVENITKRNVVSLDSLADKSKPCSMFDDAYDSGVCGGGNSFCRPFLDGHYCTKGEQIEVPYRFCSDEYNWSTPDCQTHDEGTDAFQMVANHIDDYEAYWPFRAYKRDNDLFSPSSGYWGRVMYTMQFYRKHFEHWAYSFSRYNKGDWWEKEYGTPWHLDVNGGLGKTIAVQEVFETMANVFGRPATSYYGWNEAKGRYEPVVNNGKNQYQNIFEVREDKGARPMYPSYDFSGYLYTPARAGTFYDRLGALMMMTYPMTMFTRGVDTMHDMQRFRINFATVWPQRVQNILSGMITGEPSMFGWCIEHDDVPPTEGGSGDPTGVKFRKWFGTAEDMDAYYSNCVPLTPEPEYSFPTTQYRLPAIAAIYGMGWMGETWDRTFVDRTRVWLDGEGNDLTVPEGFEVVTYTDPFSGKTYKAPYDPNEFDPSKETSPRVTIPAELSEGHRNVYWPTARLLTLANNFKAEFDNPQDLSENYGYSDLQQMIGRIEIIRGLHQYFEYGY